MDTTRRNYFLAESGTELTPADQGEAVNNLMTRCTEEATSGQIDVYTLLAAIVADLKPAEGIKTNE